MNWWKVAVLVYSAIKVIELSGHIIYAADKPEFRGKPSVLRTEQLMNVCVLLCFVVVLICGLMTW